MKLKRQRMYFAQHDPTSWPISVSDCLSHCGSLYREIIEIVFSVCFVVSAFFGFSDFSSWLPWKFWMMHTPCCFNAALAWHRTCGIVGALEWWRMLGKSGWASSQWGRLQQFLASSCATIFVPFVSGVAARDATFVRDELTDLVNCWSLDSCTTLAMVSCCDLSLCKFCNWSKKRSSGES